MLKKLDKTKLLEGNSGIARAVMMPETINKEERSVEILISTETPILKHDSWSGEKYEEVLLHGEENIDLTRASNAKLRWMHGSGQYGELPIGRLENVRIENRQLRAKAIFSQANPNADMFWHMVEEETLSEISVGGSKRELRITEREGNVSLVEVTRWEFHEASLVDIGADPKAGIGRNLNNNEGEIMNKLEELRRQLEKLQADKAPETDVLRKMDEINAEIKRVQDESNEIKRVAGIKELAALHVDLGYEDVKRFISDKTKTPDDFARALLEAKTKNQQDVSFQQGEQTAGADDVKRAVADSLIMRAGFKVEQPHKDVKRFEGASLLDLARAITGFTGFNKEELINRAMSTSDFPILLSNAANKMLEMAFDEENATFEAWTTSGEVKDFKQGVAAHLKAGGRLQKVAEKGELKNFEFGEGGEVFKLETYGAEFSITRQMLINDDLGAFVDVVSEFGKMARRTANGLVYDLLQGKGSFSSYKMSDSKAIFHTDHKNVTSTGTALATATLTSGRTLMRRQEEDGKALNIVPKFLLVSPENETSALQLISSEADPSSSNSGVVNPHKNSVTVIVDSELDAKPWYLSAPRRTIKVLYLQGQGKKPVVKEKTRDLSGMTYQCVFDFGVYAEDYRGLYKNVGA
ncbi:MAG: Mu-like prophage major head subunit gpT family protein [Sulfurospirillaceae bacterium]|nr:Mu-like prophage major head subunit gpT family protein [Sulfurospirillaceae bacterium]